MKLQCPACHGKGWYASPYSSSVTVGIIPAAISIYPCELCEGTGSVEEADLEEIA